MTEETEEPLLVWGGISRTSHLFSSFHQSAAEQQRKRRGKKIHFPAESECRKRSVETSAWWWHDRVMLWKCACSFLFLLRFFFLLTGRYFLGASSLYSVASLFFYTLRLYIRGTTAGPSSTRRIDGCVAQLKRIDEIGWAEELVFTPSTSETWGKKEDISSCCAVYLWMM